MAACSGKYHPAKDYKGEDWATYEHSDDEEDKEKEKEKANSASDAKGIAATPLHAACFPFNVRVELEIFCCCQSSQKYKP